MFHRGGGNTTDDQLLEWVFASNCSEFCVQGMRFGGMDGCCGAGRDPHYVRCFDAFNYVPINRKRMQFVSQESTMDIDPAVPKMNITHAAACMRIKNYKDISCSFLK